MNDTRVVVLTPIYKTELSNNEITALQYSFSVLKTHDIFFICPRNLDITFYLERFPQVRYAYYGEHYFVSTKSYSELLISPNFYESFSKYSHMLIVQQDCMVFKDDLAYWVSSGYDFIGAPWATTWVYSFPQMGSALDEIIFHINVGNGGFSLRKIAAFIDVLAEFEWYLTKCKVSEEDAFFSLAGHISTNFKVPNAIVASQFSIECEPQKYLKISNQLPMGTHAWEKYDKELWLEIFKQNGIHGLS